MRSAFALLISATAFAAAQTAPVSGELCPRLIIRNAIVIEFNGAPAAGPQDIVIENNIITAVVPVDPVSAARGSSQRPQGNVVIDAGGKYVVPGLINAQRPSP